MARQPDFKEYMLGDDEPPPLPEGLAEQLAIDLRPTPTPASPDGSSRAHTSC